MKLRILGDPTTLKIARSPEGGVSIHLEDDLSSKFQGAVRSANVFSAKLGETLRAFPTVEFDQSLELAMHGVKPLFQKWTMEMLFVLAVAEKLRFNQIKSRLKGISSRTLSTKLQELEHLGLVERAIVNERPIRIEYRLTQKGKTVSGLTAPLVVFMSWENAGNAPPA